MKDIDFDELDRAVSSLMGRAPSDKKNDSQTETPKTLPKESSAENVSVASNSSPTPRPQPSPSGKRPLPTSPGRFMDLVGPKVPKQVSTPSREGVTITPRQSSPAAETPQSTASQTSVPVRPTSSTLNNSSNQSASDEPISSPFLPNAKVEKRPLGGAGIVKPQGDDAVDVEKNQSAEESAPSTDTPAEFDQKLIAIESADSRPVNDQADSSQHASSSDHSSSYEPPKSTSTSSAFVSQSSEKPHSDDQNHATIYDTSSYVQPLAHPAKRKSGWMWVVWIVLLLAIGSGGAVALYNLGII